MTNFEAYRGDTWSAILKVTNSGTAQDITGWSFYFTLKSGLDDVNTDGAAFISKDVTSHLSATGGMTQILLSSTDTNSLTGNYSYDIQYKDLSGNVKTVLAGDFKFKRDATRRTT